MILGSYYLTMQVDGERGEGMYFKDDEEALLAYQNGDLELHAKINIRRNRWRSYYSKSRNNSWKINI